MKDIRNCRELLDRHRGSRDRLANDLSETEAAIDSQNKMLVVTEEAQAIIQHVARETQEQLKVHIEDIVSMALEAVFPNPYRFEVDFVTKSNRTQAECWLVRDDERVDPMMATGGGVVDIVSFALRVTLWTLGKTASLIVLDEPFRFVSRDLQVRAGEMMKRLSKRLGVQFVMVTHSQDMIDAADRVFDISMGKDGRSLVLDIGRKAG